MHSQSTIDRAKAMRRQGVPIKTIALELGVSVGWASTTLQGVETPVAEHGSFLKASAQQLNADRMRYEVMRHDGTVRTLQHRQETRWSAIQELIDSTKGLSRRPAKAESAYKSLDNLQTLFANEPGHWLFGLMGSRSPELLSHLVAWSATKRLGDKPSTIKSFMPMVEGVVAFIKEHRRAPASNGPTPEERNLAKFVGRWKANAAGNAERSCNEARAQGMLRLCKLVDQVRSRYPDERAEALSTFDSMGAWLTRSVAEAVEDGMDAGLPTRKARAS